MKRTSPYKTISVAVIAVLAVLFIFPLYWILTGSVKDAAAINAAVPQWFPLEPTTDNYIRLFSNPALRWLFNSVFMAVMAMILTCITASMAGYALAKKRFVGKQILFSVFICAMALPKQVILIPLLKEMAFLNLHDNLWAVILPTVGWPFGVFLMKQFPREFPGSFWRQPALTVPARFRLLWRSYSLLLNRESVHWPFLPLLIPGMITSCS